MSVAQELQLKGLSGSQSEAMCDMNKSLVTSQEAEELKIINIKSENMPYSQEMTEMATFTNDDIEETSLDNSRMVQVDLADISMENHRAKMEMMMEKIHDGE